MLLTQCRVWFIMKKKLIKMNNKCWCGRDHKGFHSTWWIIINKFIRCDGVPCNNCDICFDTDIIPIPLSEFE